MHQMMTLTKLVFHLGGQQADDHPGQEQAQDDTEPVIGPVEAAGDDQGEPEEDDGADGTEQSGRYYLGQVRQRVFNKGVPRQLPAQPGPHRLGGQTGQQIQAACHDELYQHVPDQDVGKNISLDLEPHGQKGIEIKGITHHGLRDMVQIFPGLYCKVSENGNRPQGRCPRSVNAAARRRHVPKSGGREKIP